METTIKDVFEKIQLKEGWEKIQGARLTECRKRKKLSRTQLGLKISVSMETIKKYENGERSKGLNDPRTLTALSKALEVEKGYLSGDDYFFCENYTEYLEDKAENKALENNDLNKYSKLLLMGEMFVSSALDNNNQITYSVAPMNDSSNIKRFSEQSMKLFYDKILEELKKSTQRHFNDYEEEGDRP